MWSYYGSKSKIAKLYPKPKYNLIIEPFAGAAWYSVLHRNHQVFLNESNRTIHGIWDWLIHQATSKLIGDHVDFHLGQDIRKIHLLKEHKDLVGFCINRGSTSPRNIVQKWSCQVKNRPDWASTTAYQLKRIAKLLPEIRHWKIQFGDYQSLPDVKATWFIDPPYQFGGRHYVEHQIDYPKLADWCKSRKGQIIICENDQADWLPFQKLTNFTGQRRKTTEMIWLNKGTR